MTLLAYSDVLSATGPNPLSAETQRALMRAITALRKLRQDLERVALVSDLE